MINFNYKIIVLLFTVIFISCTQEEQDFIISQEKGSLDEISNVTILDKVDNDEIEVTTEYLKMKWQNALKEEGFSIKLEKFEILESFDEEKGIKTFFLRTVSRDKTISTGAFLTKKSDGVYMLGSKTCTCEGCPQGCNVVVSGSTCSCSPCTGHNKSCTKKETIIIN